MGGGGRVMTLLHNFTRGVVTSIMKRHTGRGGGQKMGKLVLLKNNNRVSNVNAKTHLQVKSSFAPELKS